MAKVKVWDGEAFEYIEAQRRYEELEIMVTYGRERGYGYPERVSHLSTFFVDEETGIVTRDVAKFEKWIGGLK